MDATAAKGQHAAPPGFLCRSPFEYVHLQANGDVYPCCPSKFGKVIGNVRTTRLRDVWDSAEAREVRASILDGSYRFCNGQACEYLRDAAARGTPLSPLPLVRWAKAAGLVEAGPAPKVINVSFDRSCNLACGYCRSELFSPDPAERRVIARIDENIFESSLEGAERIILLGEGDPFASPIYREKLRRYDWDRHPALKIKIQSNGLLLTPEMWASVERSHSAIDWISISVDAASAETYRRNRGGAFALLMRNLEFVANLRALGYIERFFINFLVLPNNFREMPAFAALGRRLGCDLIEFQRVENWGCYSDEEFRQLSIHESWHPDHEAFRRVLDDPLLQDPAVWLLKLAPSLPATTPVSIMSCRDTR